MIKLVSSFAFTFNLCPYAMGCPLSFHQRNMEYFRKRIIADGMNQGRN